LAQTFGVVSCKVGGVLWRHQATPPSGGGRI